MSKRRRSRARRPADEKTAAGPPLRRQLVFSERFLDDLRYWVQTDPRMAERVLRLVDLVSRDPAHGEGRPEPLKHLTDTWSRRINKEHRLTCRVTAEYIEFLQARYHYEK